MSAVTAAGTTSWHAPFAMLPEGIRAQVRITTKAGRIHAVEPDIEPAQTDVRLPGLLLPGLANAHSHAFHRALRGRTHGDGGSFWTWRERMYEVAATLTPERYLDLARAVFAEMVLAGFTVVGEFHYVHHAPGGTPYEHDAMREAVVTAAAEAGIRLTLLDTIYLTGGLDAHGYRSLDALQQRYGDGSVQAWAARAFADRVETGTARVGAAVHSVRAVPADDLAAVRQALDAHGIDVLHAHVSEQVGEVEATQAVHGCTPVQLLSRAGLVDSRFTAVHATHLSEEDIAGLGRARAFAAFCPMTERDLGDGIGPARELLDVGARLCLGTDQHVTIDPFAELQGLEGHERLRSLERGRFTPAELLASATYEGYACLGWDGGRIAQGALADFVAVRTDSVRTIGSAPEQVPLTASATDVTDVVVAGEHVVAEGMHRLGDVAALLQRGLAPWSGQATNDTGGSTP
ncbi:formimidoylglutamate deiminase [Janibacter cremeus]|uniref:Formiminoglutamate deiminase n=1 Tax=Janibacter cremeus TaxID=1285192 RepID=A0A852VKJ3_9MICO|nr:formimidoylglutamate deiminase [Janibacter cremeus]NYF97572.1 formiminoglutamate deiminase [Janibacter cremeus]